MIQKSDDEWKAELTPEQYAVLREQGTEAPFSGKLLNTKEDGSYSCGACGATVFKSESKYDSTTPGLIGWPSFSDAVDKDAVNLLEDNSLGMQRTEVVCANCGSHLGHLFDDATSPNGQHYCINSVALKFEQKDI